MITLPKVILAPLAGCTDLPFRMIAREHGAKFCFYEMVDSNSLIYERRQSYAILKTNEEDKPVAAQLLGSDPAAMLDAAGKLLNKVSSPFLDINCACPAKKVLKKKAGAYLLRDAPRMYEILKKLVKGLDIPVTVKIRIGFDKKDDRHIVSIARQCEDLGVCAIFVHGRLMTQRYAGDVDYAAIKKIKEAVRIPVFGSGNIFSGQTAKEMLDKTGCNGVLAARGALGNPWIFREIEEYITTGRAAGKISYEEKKRVLLKHLDYVNRFKQISEYGKIGYMRGVAIWYTRHAPHAATLRKKITSVKSYSDLLNSL